MWPCGWCKMLTPKELLAMVLERVGWCSPWIVYLCPTCQRWSAKR
jgi:hypothetical protein